MICAICGTWCRDMGRETQNGRYPIPDHSPMCTQFKLEKFVELRLDGIACIMRPEDVDHSAEEMEGVEVIEVLLTQDQFDKIGERGDFSGF